MSKQKVLIWHGVKMPQDVATQVEMFRAMQFKEDMQQGYCSCCGYNFIMNVFSAEKKYRLAFSSCRMPKIWHGWFSGGF